MSEGTKEWYVPEIHVYDWCIYCREEFALSDLSIEDETAEVTITVNGETHNVKVGFATFTCSCGRKHYLAAGYGEL